MAQDLSRKSEAWLIDAIRNGTPDEVERAFGVIMQENERQIRAYVGRGVPDGHLEDTMAVIWEALWLAIRKREVRVGIPQLLQGIADHKRSDVGRLLDAEKRIELGIPMRIEADAAVDEWLAELEESTFEQQFVRQAAYDPTILSACEQTIWTLRSTFGFAPRHVARLMGKVSKNISDAMTASKKKVKRHVESEFFQPSTIQHDLVPAQAIGRRYQDMEKLEKAVLIEQFSERMQPAFTEDELKPLGISPAEFAKAFDAMLMVPRWYTPEPLHGAAMEFGLLSLLVMEKIDEKTWEKTLHKEATGDPANFALPEACLVDVDLVDGHFQLRVNTVVEIFGQPVNTELPDDTYLSMHDPYVRVPVFFAPWSPDMFEDPEFEFSDGARPYERWPFLEALAADLIEESADDFIDLTKRQEDDIRVERGGSS